MDRAVQIRRDCPAKKAALLQDGDDSFFARGDRRELDRPAIDVENGVSGISLGKDDLFVPVVPKSHLGTESSAEKCVTDTETTLTRHSVLLLHSAGESGSA
jgi:hypothetical protein